MSERVSDAELAILVAADSTGPDDPISETEKKIISMARELIARRAAERDAVAVAFGVRNDQGYWTAIWTHRAAAENVCAKGQPSHHETVVPLYALPAAPEK